MFHVKHENVLILPGWQNSGPEHWQSRWETLHGYCRVDQHDWVTPKRGDWMARLEEVVLGCNGPVALVAHSLGCILTAAMARAWGSRWVDLGEAGHINAESGLGDWPQGHAWLLALVDRSD